MRKLLIIPGLLFGLMFAGGGFFFLSETALPMWQNWQRMQDWRPAYARLLSVSGSDNETLANYQYDFGGGSYQGNGVGVSESKDNIGSYHPDMQAYLRNIKNSGEALPIWVNPTNPNDSVIDRDMRWGLFAFMSGFCSIFILIGLGVIYGSIQGSSKLTSRKRPSLWKMRKAWQRAKKDGQTNLEFVEFCQQRYADTQPQKNDEQPSDWQSRKGWEKPQIASDATKGVWFIWFFAILWNAISIPLVSVLPDEFKSGNYVALVGLLFPLAGIFLLYKAIALTLAYRHFGKVLVTMDPYPGAIGGHVGGHIQIKSLDYQRANAAKKLNIKLECVYSYVSGSGKNRSRRESIKWAEQGKPKIDNAMQGVNLTFRFDIPADLPQADVEQKGAYHFWRLSVNADIPGIDLARNYNIPVFATAEKSRSVSHDISQQVEATRQQEADAAKLAISSGNFDIDGLSRAMRLDTEGNQIHLKFPMFRNKALTMFAAIFAVGFGFACYSMSDMASDGGLFGIFIVIFAIPFFLVALAATVATIYLLFNNLRVSIHPGNVSVLRRLLFIPIYRRQLTHGDIKHLSIKRSGSTGQGVEKIEHFKIRAQDKQGSHVTLAEDIDGEDVATHFRDYLAQRIGVAVE